MTAHFQVPTTNTGLLKVPQSDEAAAKLTELLEQDLKDHHVFFNASHFHNHIVHHLLALYGTGASAKDLTAAYHANTSYQLPATPPNPDVVRQLHQGWSSDCPYLGAGEHYADFLAFFHDEIAAKGWHAVVHEYVFKGDERSDDLMQRLFAGLLHPMIQLMYGIEWSQPTIIAQGLAQTAVHENRRGPRLLEIEKLAALDPPNDTVVVIPELFEAVRRNDAILQGSRFSRDDDAIDHVFAQAGDHLLHLLKQVRVHPDEVDAKTAEMIHSMAYVSAATAFHPPHIPKWDFFFIHHLNASLFFVTISRLPFISQQQKARILEWKIRSDIIEYVARGSAPLNLDAVRSLAVPEEDVVANPEDLLPRYHGIVDDGHTIKVVRSLLVAQKLSEPYARAGEPWLRLASDDDWLKVHHLLLQAAARPNPRWVFGVGFDEAWDKVALAN